jgi:simple sugar transport system permease protein
MLEGALGIAIGGESVVHFEPDQLVSTLVRATPYLLAGLAVALGFHAGLFNIGAEGQLYAGALVTAFIGYAGIFDVLPGFLRIPLAMIGGIAGGALWGAIPGFLKARTGAHEVINTIMMNYIAIRLADYLIKSRDPIIMLDETASVPRTPYINPSAELPTLFGTDLHIGLFVALGAAVFVWWFLYKTTLGFELRTVGANPDAARYAGMSIPRTLVIAMGISGALAGLAGAGEVLGNQHNMQPGFFGGVGFDSIAVALLAKNKPFAMIPAALLWGGLLSGAGLMQVRADMSIDLVKIIQAFMIMFIAADQIVRYLWRIKAESGGTLVSLRGWGG